MDEIALLAGLTVDELIMLAILAVVLVIAWFFLRAALKLTATLFRAGCIAIFLFIAAGFLAALIW